MKIDLPRAILYDPDARQLRNRVIHERAEFRALGLEPLFIGLAKRRMTHCGIDRGAHVAPDVVVEQAAFVLREGILPAEHLRCGKSLELHLAHGLGSRLAARADEICGRDLRVRRGQQHLCDQRGPALVDQCARVLDVLMRLQRQIDDGDCHRDPADRGGERGKLRKCHVPPPDSMIGV